MKVFTCEISTINQKPVLLVKDRTNKTFKQYRFPFNKTGCKQAGKLLFEQEVSQWLMHETDFKSPEKYNPKMKGVDCKDLIWKGWDQAQTKLAV